MNRITKEIFPNQEEIHTFFNLTIKFNANSIHTINSSISVLIETKLDPSLIEHYFEISFQCINMIDWKGEANGSLNILAALILSIEKSEILINKFETLFLLIIRC